MKILYSIFSLILIFNCSEKTSECKCFNGIGSDNNSMPLKTYKFSNNKSVSICGFSENNLFSEFNVFDCENGKSLVQYDALENCEIEFQNDEIIIFETLILPNNEHWYFSQENISEQKIKPHKNELVVENKKPLKVNSKIPKNQQDEFLKNLHKTNLSIEAKLNRLETLAIIGNVEAKKVLQNFKNENFLDGANKEYYNEIIERLKFREKNGR